MDAETRIMRTGLLPADVMRNRAGMAVQLCLGLLLLLGSQAIRAEVYRWVDENGEVHYSESLPADFEDKAHDVMDRRGIVLKEDVTTKPEPVAEKPVVPEKGELPRDSSGMKRPKPLYPPDELQRRLDAMLLLRYESEQDLIDEMNVEISQLAYDERLIMTSLNSVKNAYRANVKEAGDRQRAGVNVPEDMATTLGDLRARLVRNETSLALLKRREMSIREQFDTERARYRKLAKEAEEAEEAQVAEKPREAADS